MATNNKHNLSFWLAQQMSQNSSDDDEAEDTGTTEAADE